MKNFYLLASLIFVFYFGKSFSQNLLVSMPDTFNHGVPGADVECFSGDTLFNNTSGSLTIDVVRVQNVTTAGWTTAFCLNVCYLPSKDSVRFTLSPNQHQNFILHFYTSTTPDSGTCVFKFKNVSNPSNVFYQRYYAATQTGYAVHDLNANLANVSIYPMPVSAKEPVTMNVSNVKTASAIKMEIYNMLGCQVSSKNVVEGANFLNIDLPAGIYSYSLISSGLVINSGKIAVRE